MRIWNTCVMLLVTDVDVGELSMCHCTISQNTHKRTEDSLKTLFITKTRSVHGSDTKKLKLNLQLLAPSKKTDTLTNL